MPYPDSAIVNSRGELLVGLSDGTIINAGKVIGPEGVRGASGLPGLRGEPGKDGISCIAAFKPPSQDDGAEGWSWIDCSSAEFAFYRRSGNGWNKIANLRQPAPDRRVGVSGGGAGTGGGGEGAGSTTYGSTFPASPSVGDQHVMDDTLYEYVYTGAAWLQIVSPGGGGGGGATTLGQLADVNLTGTQEGEVLAATNSSTWVNSQNIDGGTF